MNHEPDDPGTRDPVGPPDPRVVPRFAGPDTFARLPRLDDVGRASVAVVGVPFDAGVSYRSGARFGPAAIRMGSKLLRPFDPALDVEPWQHIQVADAGDVTCTPFDIAQALEQIDAGVTALLARAERVIALGGDHTVALPVLRALSRVHGPLALVHFDAHLDTYDAYFGARLTHGTPFRRAFEERLVTANRSMHVGIRGPLYSREDLTDDQAMGYAVISTIDVARTGVDAVIEQIRARVGSGPAYVSVDIDVLDPAHAPGTGTPEPGGLTSRELLMLLRGLDGLSIVGADIVEVAPPYDHAELTALAAANLAYEFIGLFARQSR